MQSNSTGSEYFAYDGLGSVRQILDGSGTVLTSQTFDPYGRPYVEDASAESSFGWTGEQIDESGLGVSKTLDDHSSYISLR